MFKTARRGNAKNLEQYYQYSLEYNCTHQLTDIKQPVLVVYGKKDKIFSYYAKRMYEKLHAKIETAPALASLIPSIILFFTC